MSVGIIEPCDEQCGAPEDHEVTQERRDGPRWSEALRFYPAMRTEMRRKEARSKGLPVGWSGIADPGAARPISSSGVLVVREAGE